MNVVDHIGRLPRYAPAEQRVTERMQISQCILKQRLRKNELELGYWMVIQRMFWPPHGLQDRFLLVGRSSLHTAYTTTGDSWL